MRGASYALGQALLQALHVREGLRVTPSVRGDDETTRIAVAMVSIGAQGHCAPRRISLWPSRAPFS